MELVLLFACIRLSFLNQVAIVFPFSKMYFQVHFDDWVYPWGGCLVTVGVLVNEVHVFDELIRAPNTKSPISNSELLTILSSPSERTKTMNTELEMSSNYSHRQEPPHNVLTPVHFNGGAYRQVPPQNHHQIPTHFTGTGYEHQCTPNRRLPVDTYPITSPYIRNPNNEYGVGNE